MDVLEIVRARYSVRAYRPDPVEDEKLQLVLEAARLAPTAANRQPFRLIVLRTAGREQEIGRIYGRRWFTQAPLVLGVIAVPGEAWRRMDGKPYDEVDATIAMDHVILAAASLGLGTCWVAAFDPAAAREVLGLPDEVEPIAFTPLGYPADEPRQKTRRPLEELVKYERW
jgi:nitroreductase